MSDAERRLLVTMAEALMWMNGCNGTPIAAALKRVMDEQKEIVQRNIK